MVIGGIVALASGKGEGGAALAKHGEHVWRCHHQPGVFRAGRRPELGDDLSATLATYLPDTELTISFGVQNGEAVAKTMTIDYIFAARER